jgi:hypothetical protein
MGSKHETGTSKATPLPPDVTVSTAAYNLPDKFAPTNGSVDFLDLFILVAGATMDKKAKVGDEVAWNWNGGGDPGISLKGTTKLVSIDLARKRFVGEVRADWELSGQHMSDLIFTSTYDMADGSLISSEGEMKMATRPDKIKITRKP